MINPLIVLALQQLDFTPIWIQTEVFALILFWISC